MKPTQAYIEQKFAAFNELCFDGKLPEVPIRMSRARSYLGQLAFKRRRVLFRGWVYSDFVLRISTCLDMPETEVEDTLLHEMIHLYICSNQLKDSSVHGHLFRRMMADINHRFGRHITISHRKSKEDQAQDTQRRAHFICVSTLQSGELGITIAAKSRLFRLWDAVGRFAEVTETRWLLSYDPYFNRFPRALTPKIYRVDNAELREHLTTAKPLIRQGNTIMAGRAASG